MVSEKSIEAYLSKKVKQEGGLSIKFTSPNFMGIPDRLVVLPGGNISFWEIKAPGQKPRKIQLFIINKLKSLGCKVYVVDNTVDIDTHIILLLSQGN